MILRDSEDYGSWTSAADGTLEDRVYSCQNAGGWRADVVAIVDDAGSLLEWARYDAYGRPTCFCAGDTDSDGDVDSPDTNAITAGNYDVRKDLNLDGTRDSTDIVAALNNLGTCGRGMLSRPDVASRIGYAGYQYDGAIGVLYHVRHRVLHTTLGRWTRRDPLGYVNGRHLYEYAQSGPIVHLDPTRLFCLPTPCGWPVVTGCSVTINSFSAVGEYCWLVDDSYGRGRFRARICNALIGQRLVVPCPNPDHCKCKSGPPSTGTNSNTFSVCLPADDSVPPQCVICASITMTLTTTSAWGHCVSGESRGTVAEF